MEESDKIIEAEMELRSGKRIHESDKENSEEISDEEWKTVQSKKKQQRKEGSADKKEIYISSEECLPKQFALAKLLLQLEIKDITNIKYLNPYKIRVTFDREIHLKELEVLKNKGWRINTSSEVSYSYGVIKDVDMDLTDEEIIQNISCPEPAELLSLRRLSRRNRDEKEGRWTPSESVRLCFKGSWLPKYVYVHGVRVHIEPYVYPVTQCFKCWSLGHTAKTCVTKKDVCPKCSGDHANCNTKIFTCVNCSGRHMAMAKICPAYLKEKEIRVIMAEHNCTYIRAAQLYAATPMYTPVARSDPKAMIKVTERVEQAAPRPGPSRDSSPSCASIQDTVSEKSVILQPKIIKMKTKKAWNIINEEKEKEEEQKEPEPDNQKRTTTLVELISRIKEVIFLRNVELQDKISRVVKLCLEWLVIVVVESASDWPMASLIQSFLNPNG